MRHLFIYLCRSLGIFMYRIGLEAVGRAVQDFSVNQCNHQWRYVGRVKNYLVVYECPVCRAGKITDPDMTRVLEG